MKRSALILSIVALAGLAAEIPAAQAASNPGLCFAIAQNYNNCVRAQSRPRYWGGGYGGYGGGYGGGYDDDGYRRGGYGGGYGGYGGNYRGYDDYDDELRQYRRSVRRQRAQAQCAIWLAQMQANGCI